MVKIKNINNLTSIFKSDFFRYAFLVELISSDKVIDKKTCQDSIDQIIYIKDHLKDMDLEDSTKQEINEFLNKGLDILNRDLNNF